MHGTRSAAAHTARPGAMTYISEVHDIIWAVVCSRRFPEKYQQHNVRQLHDMYHSNAVIRN